jgi:ABC-type glycerol-3-phosphate transport system permease component
LTVDNKVGNLGKNIILIILSVFIIYPFLWLTANSFKSMEDMVNNSWSLLPKLVMWKNYQEAWIIGKIGRYFVNSMTVSVLAVLILVIVCYLGSYALARIDFKGRNLFMVLFLSTWMLPPQIILIPLFKVERLLHINNTLAGLILPYAAGTLPFSVFVMTAFLRKIPVEIEEAAFIDGAGRLKLIWSILLPLSRPGLATVVIFSFMQNWNEFFMALVLIQDPALKTLTLGVLNFSGQWGQIAYNRLFAALVIISVPVITVYVIFQKQFISGLAAGAVKS